MHDKKIFLVNFQNKGIIYQSDEIKNWEKMGKCTMSILISLVFV